MIVILILIFGVLGIFEAYPLIRKQYWKELIVLAVLMFTGFSVSILIVLGVELPRVGDLITLLFKNIFGMKS